MGAMPKQHDPASRERNPEHDQLSAGVLSFIKHAYARSRPTLLDSTIADEKLRGSLRSAAALIVIFQVGYAAQQLHSSAPRFDATLSLVATNIAIGVAFFLSTFVASMPRYWRQIGLLVCIALLISASGIGAMSMRVEPVFISLCVIVIGAGTLAPWDWPWQAAVSCAGMICFFLVGRLHGVVDSDPPMHWLGFATAVGLAQSNVYLQMNNRRTHAQTMADRFISDQKLKDSEEKFRQIFEQSGDMVVVNNLDTGAILEVNNQFVKRSRVPRELVIGRMDTDFNFFADPAAREQFMKELVENGVVHNLEVQLNGIGYDRPMPALISAVVVRLNNQKCAIIVVREISDVREAERKMRNSETTLRKIFDANLDSITTTDALTRCYTDVNHEFTRSTGFSREEVVGKTYWEIGVWPSREESDKFSAAMMRDGEVRNMRAKFYAKDGTLIPCLMSGAMVELDGKLSVLTITRNIGDLLAAEQKLQSSEAMLREIFDSSVDNIALTDLSDGIIIDVNNEMVRSLGLAKSEMVGKRFDEVKVWESNERLTLFTETLLKHREVRNFETTFRTASGGTFPALISAVVLELGGRECALSIARDVTDLEAARQKALAASQAKTEFLSSMSHEIRTPMNAILGMADLIGESDLSSNSAATSILSSATATRCSN